MHTLFCDEQIDMPSKALISVIDSPCLRHSMINKLLVEKH